MKFSKFNVYDRYDDDSYWVYNTLSTATIILNNADFCDVFVNENLDSEKVDIAELCAMGYVIDDQFDELSYLKDLRETVVNSDKCITDIMVAPTMDCNARCYYCFEHGSHREKMSRETADAVVEYIGNHWDHKLFNVSWFGGEPLTAVDVIDYLSTQLKSKNIRFTSKILTNGYELTETVVQRALRDWNTTKVQISIDDLFDDYDNIKKFKHSSSGLSPFKRVIENTHNALCNGLSVRVRINFNPIKKDSAMSVMDYLQENFGDFSNFSSYFAPIDSFSDIVPPIAGEFPEFDEHPFLSLIKHSQKYGYYVGNNRDSSENFAFDEKGILASLKLYPSPTNCYASCPSVFAIDSKGDFYKCHRVLGRGEKYCSGNVKSGVLKNEIYQFFCNTDLVFEECKECALLPICQGGCKINAYIYRDNHACSPMKSILKKLIDYYVRRLLESDKN